MISNKLYTKSQLCLAKTQKSGFFGVRILSKPLYMVGQTDPVSSFEPSQFHLFRDSFIIAGSVLMEQFHQSRYKLVLNPILLGDLPADNLASESTMVYIILELEKAT